MAKRKKKIFQTIPFSIIVAADQQGGIGKQGKLPWHLPLDLKHFKEITSKTKFPKKKNIVIMGRKTWESLPLAFRPLLNRINIVLSHRKFSDLPQGVYGLRSLDAALQFAAQKLKKIAENIFVIGGAQVFQEALRHPRCQKIYLTRILYTFSCDVSCPFLTIGFQRTFSSSLQKENNLLFYFEEYHVCPS